GGGVEGEYVGTQPLRRSLERQPGARGGLEEQRAHGRRGERAAGVGGAAMVDEGLRAVEQRHQRFARQAFQRKQVAEGTVFGGRGAHAGASGRGASGSTGVASAGGAGERATMIAAATASSAAASRRRRRPSARSTAKRCAASIELERSSTITTGTR